MKTRQILLPIALVATAAAALQPYRLVLVVGNSMEPTYTPGQVLVAKPPASTISRGDVVVVNQGGTRYVKRVAFLGGDTYPEFKVGDEWTPAVSAMALRCATRHHMPSRLVSVPAGTVFVVGDNIRESVDSRTFGPIPMDSVMYKVVGGSDQSKTPYYAGVRFARGPYVASRD